MSTAFAHLPIVTDGLVFSIDAYNRKSYVSGGTVYDLTTSNITGGTINGVTFDNFAWDFNGSSDYINFDEIDYLVNGFDENSPYSIDVWVNFGDVSTQQWFLSTTDTGSNNGVNMWVESGGIRFGNSSPTINVASIIHNTTTTLLTDTWYNIVGIKDDSGLTTSAFKLFINGGQESVVDTLNNYVGSMTPDGILWLGKRRYLTGNPCDVKISQLKIYNKPLTSQQVLQNYNALKGRFI